MLVTSIFLFNRHTSKYYFPYYQAFLRLTFPSFFSFFSSKKGSDREVFLGHSTMRARMVRIYSDHREKHRLQRIITA